jgi:hypothetical protein
MPSLLAMPGIVGAWVGRHGAGDVERVLATTWTALPHEPTADVDLLARLAPTIGEANVGSIETLTVAVAARFERAEPGRVLRILHGRVHSGQLALYIAEARSGMEADAATNDGLIAFILGSAAADTFATLTEWTDWHSIEQATGGNIRQPITTRNIGRLAEFSVTHYEILPDMTDAARR